MPPFKSSAQRSYLHAKKPKVAAEFEKDTPKGAKLPKHVGDKSNFHRKLAGKKPDPKEEAAEPGEVDNAAEESDEMLAPSADKDTEDMGHAAGGFVRRLSKRS